MPGLIGVAAIVSLPLTVVDFSEGTPTSPSKDAELDSSSRVCRFFRNSIIRFTVSSSSPRSRKLVSEIASVLFDTNGLLVIICFLMFLSFFFFIGAGLLED